MKEIILSTMSKHKFTVSQLNRYSGFYAIIRARATVWLSQVSYQGKLSYPSQS